MRPLVGTPVTPYSRDLRQSALLKVRNGVTSLAEINRVTKD